MTKHFDLSKEALTSITANLKLLPIHSLIGYVDRDKETLYQSAAIRELLERANTPKHRDNHLARHYAILYNLFQKERERK
jgi:hypothetical protein